MAMNVGLVSTCRL